MIVEVIKWDYTHTERYSTWTSDCKHYKIIVAHYGDGTAILNDFSGGEPVAYTEHCDSFKQAKKLANKWKQAAEAQARFDVSW